MISNPYVRDDRGALRVGKADVSLDSIVIAFQDGESPEGIQIQFPAVTLEEVYGAITYYLANRPVIDQYLNEQAKRWEELRRSGERNPSSVVTRLRAARNSAVGKPA